MRLSKEFYIVAVRIASAVMIHSEHLPQVEMKERRQNAAFHVRN